MRVLRLRRAAGRGLSGLFGGRGASRRGFPSPMSLDLVARRGLPGTAVETSSIGHRYSFRRAKALPTATCMPRSLPPRAALLQDQIDVVPTHFDPISAAARARNPNSQIQNPKPGTQAGSKLSGRFETSAGRLQRLDPGERQVQGLDADAHLVPTEAGSLPDRRRGPSAERRVPFKAQATVPRIIEVSTPPRAPGRAAGRAP